MNAKKITLGLLGTLVLAMTALPAYAAPRGGRKADPRGRGGSIATRRPAPRQDARRDTNVRVRINPAPVRYEIRTETVLVAPAHYELRTEQVLVRAGGWEERVIPGRREILRDSYGRLHEVQVTPDRVERVWCPPLYETRTVRVLVPARYETRTVRVPVTDRYGTRTSPARAAIGIGLRILGQVLNR